MYPVKKYIIFKYLYILLADFLTVSSNRKVNNIKKFNVRKTVDPNEFYFELPMMQLTFVTTKQLNVYYIIFERKYFSKGLI